MLIGIRLQSWCSVGITSWRPAWSVQFFLIRCWIPDFHCLIQRSIVLTLKLTPHIFHAVPPWCSPRHTVISLAPVPFFHCKVKASRLQKISLALFASQKVWQPSTLFRYPFPFSSVFTFPFSVFRSPKVGIPFFFLEIICLCSFLAHFWIAL